ncbi:lymphocyte cytosolic protein 2a isoform X2 [Lampris incognitus]|uniref:lymphocyte cytosolic protein 2a isoform X2 n=1 Tax=Lampris incognitus TaxID=2546036 RepID=UPI0024B53DCE|nr:lymphocyte cytosolic protein 2a isoform X2 [Lampris incognitus]
MSSERIPPKAEVIGWSPQTLAEYLRRMSLPGCDKVVLNNSINGLGFLNMNENALQKFPKIHAPMISKLCTEINKKEERRGFFGKKPTVPKYVQPDTPVDDQGWDEDEFDSDDDYENPDDEGSMGDYESPTEDHERENQDSDNDYESPSEGPMAENDAFDNDYEPPPSEPTEDLTHKLCPTLPIGESDYIDNRNNRVYCRGPPPTLTPRPPAFSSPEPAQQPQPVEPSPLRRDHSPHFGGRPPAKVGPKPSAPPQVFRNKKPNRGDRGPNQSPMPGNQFTKTDKMASQPWRPQLDERLPEPASWNSKPPPPLPSSSVNRSNSSARIPPNMPQMDDRKPEPPSWNSKPPPPLPSPSVNRSNSSAPNRFVPEVRNETHDEAPGNIPRHNTFPLQSKGLLPRPVASGSSPRYTDSLSPSIPAGGSLPQKLQSALSIHRSSSMAGADRKTLPPRPAPPNLHPSFTDSQNTQSLDRSWYVGSVTRKVAEDCLRQVNKDGAYLVRDSTKQMPNQPFTLMVLYQVKVYNIQIKYHNYQYMLGTGLKVQETFPTVRDIISHYSRSPLLLIDAKNRSLVQQNQCLLSEPAGFRLG